MTACNRRSATRFVTAAICAALVTVHISPDANAAPNKPKKVAAPKPKKAPREKAPEPEPEPLPEPTPTAATVAMEAKKKEEEQKEKKDPKDLKDPKDPKDQPLVAASISLPKETTKPIVPIPKTRTLEPAHVDLKLTGNADALLAFIGAGAAADIGVARAGPGTFSLGAAGEYNFCASICWLLNTITPLEFGQRQISLWARAGYHIEIKGKGMEKFDIFPFVMAGPTFANSYVRLDNGAAEYRGTDRAIAVGAGLGANLFVAGPVFVGGEARVRYATGVYNYELVSGSSQRTIAEGSVTHWSMTGLDLMLAMGVRF
jgi:hypothetical protein